MPGRKSLPRVLKSPLLIAALIGQMLICVSADAKDKGTSVVPSDFFKLSSEDGSGKSVSLDKWKGHVVLAVNTASRCGFTRQYDGLQKLYERFKDRKFVVLAFPANDFGSQEPGDNKSIQEFCRLNFGVTFPVLGKSVATGAGQSQVFRFLTGQPGHSKSIEWNFEKFLITRSGSLGARFPSAIEPTDAKLIAGIESLLAQPSP